MDKIFACVFICFLIAPITSNTVSSNESENEHLKSKLEYIKLLEKYDNIEIPNLQKMLKEEKDAKDIYIKTGNIGKWISIDDLENTIRETERTLVNMKKSRVMASIHLKHLDKLIKDL